MCMTHGDRRLISIYTIYHENVIGLIRVRFAINPQQADSKHDCPVLKTRPNSVLVLRRQSTSSMCEQ